MKFFRLIILISIFVSVNCFSSEVVERNDWLKHFEKQKAQGTIVVLDTRTSNSIPQIFNLKRAQKRFSPASTYKIPHALFALDAGIVKDEHQVFTWDGIKHIFPRHNNDQTLRSAIRYSAIWVFDLFAKKLGDANAKNYLSLINYGNKSTLMEREVGSYWIDGELAISALEQIEFLQKLHANELPFQKAHQTLIKELMVVENNKNVVIRAKTGWQGKHGWWIGWVETTTGNVFFALNIDTPNKSKDLFKRQAITKDILREFNVLPKSAN